jgi:3-methylcrotonyl-CoA carboxylase alpha subunit
LPGTGKLLHLSAPKVSEHVRVETGVRQGDSVGIFYDPMISKLVVWDQNRPAAMQRMLRALEQYHIVGLPTNVEFVSRIFQNRAFADGGVETSFIDKHKDELLPENAPVTNRSLSLATLAFVLNEQQAPKPARNSIDSPFTRPDNLRLNHPASRTVKFMDGEREIQVRVETVGENEFLLHLPNEKNAVRVRGTLNGNDLKAFVADELINAAGMKKKK